jgi:NAD(P)-dependent dehydrogenase (short-subunit alcohol dehydrogenase family)
VNDSGETTAAAIVSAGGDAIARRCNIADADEVARTFRDVAAELGRLDILVNNAGIAHVGTIEQTTPEDLDRLYAVNVRGLFLCSRAAGRNHAGAGPRCHPQHGVDRLAHRCARTFRLLDDQGRGSHHDDVDCRGLREARDSLQLHLPGSRPDAIRRRISPPELSGREDEARRALEAYQPIGRMGTPEEVAALALYLCSDEAAFVTGQAYPIDGGVLVS